MVCLRTTLTLLPHRYLQFQVARRIYFGTGVKIEPGNRSDAQFGR